MDNPHRVVIGIGSNLDDPLAQVRHGITALARLGTTEAVSSLYRSAPWGRIGQPTFVNAAVRLATFHSPQILLRELKKLERELGRATVSRWGPRRIDFDILIFDDLEINEPDLIVPHQHLYVRAFALVPLAEIDPRFLPAVDRLDATELSGLTFLARANSV